MSQSHTTVEDLAHLLKVIADETRLRILGVLAENPCNGKDLAERLSLTPATISHHMRKLTEVGIVTAISDAQSQVYRLNGDLLRASRQTPLAQEDPAPSPSTDPDEAFRARTLRAFVDGERLKSIPSRRKQRVVILHHLMGRFSPDRSYQEREVNALLAEAHEDFATLRRELVDYGYLTRDHGVYEVARRAPPRSRQVQQEITGDEHIWLSGLISRVVETSSQAGDSNTGK